MSPKEFLNKNIEWIEDSLDSIKEYIDSNPLNEIKDVMGKNRYSATAYNFMGCNSLVVVKEKESQVNHFLNVFDKYLQLVEKITELKKQI